MSANVTQYQNAETHTRLNGSSGTIAERLNQLPRTISSRQHVHTVHSPAGVLFCSSPSNTWIIFSIFFFQIASEFELICQSFSLRKDQNRTNWTKINEKKKNQNLFVVYRVMHMGFILTVPTTESRHCRAHTPTTIVQYFEIWWNFDQVPLKSKKSEGKPQRMH